MKPSHQLISETSAWKALEDHSNSISSLHLSELLNDDDRNAVLNASHDNIFVDYSRQRISTMTLELLFDLAEASGVQTNIRNMINGNHINISEKRPVMHIALRADIDDNYPIDGVNIVPEVHKVLNSVFEFANKVRSGEFKGHTNKILNDIIVVGIGGSYLGTQFVYEAIRSNEKCYSDSKNRSLHFLSNVDPIAVSRILNVVNPENTLVIIVSKTFTTAETMLNARTLKQWLIENLGEESISKHMVAVSTAVDLCVNFGISSENIFGFWEWVGGRYSVCSSVGMLPLSIYYGVDNMKQFLKGARSVDQHFINSIPRENIPLILGLIGVWNTSFLKYSTRALLPYCESLNKLVPHIQQVDMESNGKRVTSDGLTLDFESGPVDFGEPGTNGQHSFYQLLHQGRTIPVDFIGFCESQHPIELKDEFVSNHDELMCNFFAQPDALAYGRSSDQLNSDNIPVELIPHKTFPGNRPSTVILLPKLDPYTTGQLLSMFEHRTTVEGFIWSINSFDQFGVELGKTLAKDIRNTLNQCRHIEDENFPLNNYNSSTQLLLTKYLRYK